MFPFRADIQYRPYSFSVDMRADSCRGSSATVWPDGKLRASTGPPRAVCDVMAAATKPRRVRLMDGRLCRPVQDFNRLNLAQPLRLCFLASLHVRRKSTCFLAWEGSDRPASGCPCHGFAWILVNSRSGSRPVRRLMPRLSAVRRLHLIMGRTLLGFASGSPWGLEAARLIVTGGGEAAPKWRRAHRENTRFGVPTWVAGQLAAGNSSNVRDPPNLDDLVSMKTCPRACDVLRPSDSDPSRTCPDSDSNP